MNVACFVSAALIVSAGMLAAQSANRVGSAVIPPHDTAAQHPAAQVNALNQSPVHANCPIAMRAEHVADGEMVETGNAHPRGIGQWLRLTLTGPDSRRISTATLTIRGLSPKGRAMDTLKSEDDSFAVVTRQIAQLTAGPDGHDLANLWLPGMTAVQTIEISAVNYADGSTWKHYGDMTCRVTPDGFMRVAGR